MQEKLILAGLANDSIVDGPGIRFAIFSQGCPHNCPGCHNPSTHSFEGGTPVLVERILEEIDKNPLLRGVTFSGGEPFSQAEGFLSLARGVHERGLDIVTFTGYTYEELESMAAKDPAIDGLLRETDLLVDGRFVLEERDLTLMYRGSKNQRIIDIKKTLDAGEIVLAEEYMKRPDES